MPIDLSKQLVVAVTSTALFDLATADEVFREAENVDKQKAIEDYRRYMLNREDEELGPGTAMAFVKALLSLNDDSIDGKPLVEVVVMSRNSPETGVRILKSIRSLGLNITRSAFTAGESVVPYLTPFSVDLFLSTDEADAQTVTDSGYCAAAVLKAPPSVEVEKTDQVRIAFDGDAVLFSDESEVRYKNEGIGNFHKYENQKADMPMQEGPHASFVKKLAQIQQRMKGPLEYSRLRIAVVTARNAPSEIRVIKTLRDWGVYVDEAFFLGGVSKVPVLKAFAPHIFFDDQDIHLEAAQQDVPSAKVLYKSSSVLHPKNGDRLLREQKTYDDEPDEE